MKCYSCSLNFEGKPYFRWPENDPHLHHFNLLQLTLEDKTTPHPKLAVPAHFYLALWQFANLDITDIHQLKGRPEGHLIIEENAAFIRKKTANKTVTAKPHTKKHITISWIKKQLAPTDKSISNLYLFSILFEESQGRAWSSLTEFHSKGLLSQFNINVKREEFMLMFFLNNCSGLGESVFGNSFNFFQHLFQMEKLPSRIRYASKKEAVMPMKFDQFCASSYIWFNVQY